MWQLTMAIFIIITMGSFAWAIKTALASEKRKRRGSAGPH